MTYFLTILLWATIIYGAYFVIISLMAVACCYSILCISHDRDEYKKLVKKLLVEARWNQIWFRFAGINWYTTGSVLRATRIVIQNAYPKTPFDGLTSFQIDDVVKRIRFATDNGCPQDLPQEIREWGFENRDDSNKVIDWSIGGGKDDLHSPPTKIILPDIPEAKWGN